MLFFEDNQLNPDTTTDRNIYEKLRRRLVALVLDKYPHWRDAPHFYSMFQASQFRGRWVYAEFYIRPFDHLDVAAGINAAIRGDAFVDESAKQWFAWYQKWAAEYMRNLEAAVLDERISEPLAFTAPNVGASVAALPTAPMESAAPARPPSSVASAQGVSFARRGNSEALYAVEPLAVTPPSVATAIASSPTAPLEAAALARPQGSVASWQVESVGRRGNSEALYALEQQRTPTPAKLDDRREALRASDAVEQQRRPDETVRQNAAAQAAADERLKEEEREKIRMREQLANAEKLRLAEAAEKQRVADDALAKERVRTEELARLNAAVQQAAEMKRQNDQERQRAAMQLAQTEAARKKERAEREQLAAQVVALQAEIENKRTIAVGNVAQRKALVIGNESYRFIGKLDTAREDARSIADALGRVGYSVTLKLDASEREMKAAIRVFKGQVDAGDEVAFYFSGHGIQIANANYLVPIDITGEGEEQIKDEAISLQRVLDDMHERKAKFTLAVIDACRDNPFRANGRALGSSVRGLAPTTAATGQMVIFSAGTGQRALDRLGADDTAKNGVFTRVFAKEMLRPSVAIDKIVRDTRNEVVRLARSVGHEQVPAIYDQVVGEFYFKQ